MVEAKAKELAILPFIGYERVCEYSGLIKTEVYETEGIFRFRKSDSI
jgi:hypothetical protein